MGTHKSTKTTEIVEPGIFISIMKIYENQPEETRNLMMKRKRPSDSIAVNSGNNNQWLAISTKKGNKKNSIFSSPSKYSPSDSDSTPKTDSNENETVSCKYFPESCTKLRSLYHIKKVIGKGSYGKVYLVKSKIDSHQYAIKTISRRKGTKVAMLNEVEILGKLSSYNNASQNILRYYASWEEDSTLFIKTEYCMNTLDK